MARVLTAIVVIPVLLVIVLFALSNQQPASFGFWPTDYELSLPLSLAVLGAFALGFVVGALVLRISVFAARSRARRAERSVRQLEAQVAELKARLAPPPAAGSSRALLPAA
jgi:lipopolysaccharide assembly protein A